MVLASHIVVTCYGFWLPNDPRGSWSDFVRSWELFWFGGPATKTNARFSSAGDGDAHDHAFRRAMKSKLKYPPVAFTGEQALCAARGFARAVSESGYRVFACAILPSHAHLVVERHKTPAERIAGHLKARATQALVDKDLHPFVRHRGADGRFPSVWAHRAWKVFLDEVDAIARAVQYVEENPIKEGKKRQEWSFVSK
jgi:REP element-mobilizing transposase RayT